MKVFAPLALVFFSATSAMATLNGVWTAQTQEGRLHVNMRLAPNSQFGQTMQFADFTGLTQSETLSAAATPVRFTLTREAGVIEFDGTFRSGQGSGHYTFTPAPGFLAQIRAAGAEIEDLDEWDERELFMLASLDVSAAYVRELAGLGFKNLELDEILGARIHRVTAERVRGYRNAGFDVDLDDAMSLGIHGVTPEFIREMRAAGVTIDDADDAVSLKIHRVSPEFIEEMRSLGYGGLDPDDLMSLRIHRVSPDFVRELRSLGYEDLDADDLVAMRIHGVTEEFIRSANAEYDTRLSVSDLVKLRILGRHVSRRR